MTKKSVNQPRIYRYAGENIGRVIEKNLFIFCRIYCRDFLFHRKSGNENKGSIN
jgi:hypothetical protein